MDHNPSGRRPHYHRGRRGAERRGGERRTPPQAPSDHVARASGDQVDVDQIMREIRSRVSQRHGIDLTPQQIQELAARRLEAVLDPRNVNPTLFDQLRKAASSAPDPVPPPAEGDGAITDEAIYEGSGAVRFFRRLLNPLLKLLFNPAPLIAALQTQARSNREAAARAAERERRQTEWNALHYQVLQRLVTEVSRNSLEVQALVSRVEALAARVDFNDRQIRALESTPAPARKERAHEVLQHTAPMPVESVAGEAAPSQAASGAAQGGQPDGQRRRRRRRRGKRGPTTGVEASGGAPAAFLAASSASPDDGTEDENDEEIQDGAETVDPAQADAADASSSIESTSVSAVTDSSPSGIPEPSLAHLDPPRMPDVTEAISEPTPPAWPRPGPAPTPVPDPAPEPAAGAPAASPPEPQEPQ